MKTGIELIAEERERQVSVEGWTPEHDDEHDDGALAMAAVCYASFAERQIAFLDTATFTASVPKNWPWDRKWWKPSPNPARNLVKAAALIAAELDRLNRLQSNRMCIICGAGDSCRCSATGVAPRTV